ncbi:hypothetical protein SAMN04515671_3969 [Nakamurella panacisegetis]|uniref:Uncharacterized protein n=1 Tax=Nakamurella panacisegetis TaxID=1090615 RepID=A0A1H0SAN1_9ACTN|nr:hypothetical protein [Nakamurella panacisegetis]SDP38288.1 hypothetical protein SAMN04515671_3969 [Nakamurella panacisegetis]
MVHSRIASSPSISSAPAGQHRGAAGGAGRARWVLVALEVVVAVGAVYGGVGLIADDRIGIPSEWLRSTPFSTWVWPGIFLLLIVAVPMATAAVAEVLASRAAFALTMLAGTAQVGWIVVQWLMVGHFFFLQPVMFVAGLLVMLIGWLVHRHAVGPMPRGM